MSGANAAAALGAEACRDAASALLQKIVAVRIEIPEDFTANERRFVLALVVVTIVLTRMAIDWAWAAAVYDTAHH